MPPVARNPSGLALALAAAESVPDKWAPAIQPDSSLEAPPTVATSDHLLVAKWAPLRLHHR